MTEPPTSDHPPEQPPSYTPPPAYAPPPAYTPPPAYAPPPPPAGYAVQHGEWENLGTETAPPSSARRGRGRLLAAAGVVAVLAVGGIATAIAVSDTSKHGAGSPQAAIQQIVDDINASDFAGVLDDLSPAERTAVADPVLKAVGELKRIHVLQPNADARKVDAVHASITHLTFAPDVPVNDHVRIVQLTGGTVSIAADISKIPFTKDLVNALFPNGQPTVSGATGVDIASAVQRNGGKPFRLAAQKVDGRWYPSLFYTIADNAATDSGLGEPTAADRIPAVGADSPNAAVKELVDALLGGNITRAIQLAAPDELAALHDYGGLVLQAVGSTYKAAPVHLDDLQLTPTTSSGGTRRLVLKSVGLTTNDGKKVTVLVQGSCISVTVDGDEQRVCASQTSAQINSLVQNLTGKPITAAQRTAFEHLFGSTTQAGGIVTTEANGSWFVAPVQTIFEAATSILSRMQGDDVIELIRLFASIGR